jgi:hypothetical protein
MPHVGHQFRRVPSRVAPLTAPPLEPEPNKQSADDGFDDEVEVGRVDAKPKARIASASTAAAAGQAQALSPPGSTFKNPFLGQLSIRDWDINPYQVAKDLQIR